MLEVKYLYKLTYVNGVPNSITTAEYLMEPICSKRNFLCVTLFEMAYGDRCLIERSKIFKVVPMRGEV